MAKEININQNPERTKEEKDLLAQVPNPDSKEEMNIPVAKGDLKTDLKELIASLGLSPEATQDFFVKLTDLVSTSSIDFDKFSKTIIETVRELKQQKIRDEEGREFAPTNESAKTESAVDHSNAVDNVKEENEFNYTQNTEDGAEKDTEVSFDINNDNGVKENSDVRFERATDPRRSGDTIVYSQNTGDGKEEQEVIEDSPLLNKREQELDDLAENVITELRGRGRINPLNILVYNLIPYSVASTIMRGVSLFKKNPNDTFGGATAHNFLSLGLDFFKMYKKAKYFSLAEIGFFLAGVVNFYTIQFRRGITIKDLTRGIPGLNFSINYYRLEQQFILLQKGGIFSTIIPPPNLATRFYTPMNEIQQLRRITANYIVGHRTADKQNEKQSHRRETGDKVEIDQNELTADNPETLKSDDEFEINLSNLQTEFITPDGVVKEDGLYNALKNKMGAYHVGSLYVWPVVDESESVSPQYIPFQFNPRVSESGMQARYEAMTILSRLGNLQSYVGTDSLNLTLETKYMPVAYSNEGSTSESHKDGWLDAFDMKTIQLIELAYRSLVLPYFTPSSIETGYKYFAPPLVKIIMGDKNKVKSEVQIQSSPFSNYLVYPKDVLDVQRSGEDAVSRLSGQPRFRSYRTFIITNVTIEKDIDNSPIFIDTQDDYIVKDVMGFGVSLSMIEVTPSYADVQPGFYEYYDTITNTV